MDDLNKLENEIAAEYLKKQQGKYGIKSLGNCIRYNSEINSLLMPKDDYILIKLTENSRSFMHVFINSLDYLNNRSIYFFCYSRDFNQNSNLVDSSAITISSINEQITNLLKYFEPNIDFDSIYIIEITSFSNYYFEFITKDYRKIHKLKSDDSI